MNFPKKYRWTVWIDTGGTFTDCLAYDPNGNFYRTKVLSSSALRGKIIKVIDGNSLLINANWQVEKDIFRNYSFQLLNQYHPPLKVRSFDVVHNILKLSKAVDVKVFKQADFAIISPEPAPVLAARIITQTALDQDLPPLDMLLGSTKGTNALLERKGAEVTFLITEGFKDLIEIGTQQRPDLFALNIKKPLPFYKKVLQVKERIDASGNVTQKIRKDHLKQIMRKLKKSDKSVAVAFLHSYLNPSHEKLIEKALKKTGVAHISISSEVAPSIKILPRAETAIVNAYLAPIIDKYVPQVRSRVKQGSLKIMSSAGGLTGSSHFLAKDSLLSGPAGGVVGAAITAHRSGIKQILTLDMGGTSTDVSRYDGELDYQFESQVGDARIISPALAIETVAAGGGSVCHYDGYKFSVGPQSAGADPGPACYGCSGPLTLTDVNLLLGRLDPVNFGIPINPQDAERTFKKLVGDSRKSGHPQNKEKILSGFLDIANEKMVEAIRKISLGKGYDPKKYTLLAFGGAGGQHACKVAELLEIKQILIPYDAGLLSALGIGHALIERFSMLQILKPLDDVIGDLPKIYKKLESQAFEKLRMEGFSKDDMVIRWRKLYLRFKGQESTIEINFIHIDKISEQFRKQYEQLYGHWISDREIEAESVKVVASSVPSKTQTARRSKKSYGPKSLKNISGYTDRGWKKIPVYQWETFETGAFIEGPALITSHTSTTYLEPGWNFSLDASNNALLNFHQVSTNKGIHIKKAPEEIELELFTNRFTSIAQDMGALLQRTSFSVNVKERLDFSCALLSPKGDLVVNAPHIPVHLGSLGICTRLVVNRLPLQQGDVAITNHPAYGGSHLPDITLIAPVFNEKKYLIGYVANRAHHAEIGGKRPGSMPPDARSLLEEGVVIEPTYMVKNGVVQWEEIKRLLIKSKYRTRALEENLADLNAALASIRLGQESLLKLCDQVGTSQVRRYMDRLNSYAHQCLLDRLLFLEKGHFGAKENLDDGSPLQVNFEILDKKIYIDFTHSAPVHAGNLNANLSIVASAVLYVMRILIDRELPLNEGIMKAVEMHIPLGILNPFFDQDPDRCPAVVGGNTETSQRLVDTLLKALGLAACSQGTMNNLLFGNQKFGFYETIAGGTGAGKGFDGASAVHQHMTNTRITDPEIMEFRYPVRLEKMAIRKNSGGKGKWKGGDGIIRVITFLEKVSLTTLSQHRNVAPYGLKGGENGKMGNQYIVRKGGQKEKLGGIDGKEMFPGDTVFILTPGGGGYGKI